MLRKGKQFGVRRVTPVTNPGVSDKIGKDRIMITTNGTFMTQIFLNG